MEFLGPPCVGGGSRAGGTVGNAYVHHVKVAHLYLQNEQFAPCSRSALVDIIGVHACYYVSSFISDFGAPPESGRVALAERRTRIRSGPLGNGWVFCFRHEALRLELLTMIVSMKMHAKREDIQAVCDRVREFGYKVHSIEGEERVVIGIVGVGDVTACLESIEAMPGVEKAVRISAPYKFVSKEFRPGRTQVEVNGREIGGDEFIVIAGPCSVESEKQIMESADGGGGSRRAHAPRRRLQAAHVAL